MNALEQKKRGRKPKGGKIITIPNNNDNPSIKMNLPNIILTLKCTLKDIQSNNTNNNVDNNEIICTTSDVINTKIQNLKINLHFNNVAKKSACFWCTYGFNNYPVYIPKCIINNEYQTYGCFCSPQCAVAHLIHEQIDISVRNERYQLINYLYGNIYNYKENIKPAPNPYYLLDKYYGNLNIDEYRSLLHDNKTILFINKPITCIYPELFNDNDDFITDDKFIPNI